MQAKKNTTLLVTILLSLFFLNCYSESLLYLLFENDDTHKSGYELLVQPRNSNFLIMKKIEKRSPLDGILATYAGYLTSSNPLGEITFPRHQQHTPIYIAITEKITPVLRFRHTLDHWTFSDTEATSFFRIDLVYNEQKKQNMFFIQEESLPDDNIIPYQTIIIFGNPSYFTVPVNEYFPDTHSQHWFLPPILVSPDVQIGQSNITTLGIAPLLRPLSIRTEKPEKRARKLIRMQK
jgi:hypothetical protein